jgi:two-component system, LuxR family, response regulator FixJ
MAGPSTSVAGTVIIIEDDPDLLRSLGFSLELEGFTVQLCESAEALSADMLPKEGCLVIDHILPGKSGLDLLCDLRAQGVMLPAIIITSNPGAPLRARATACRARIIEKPLLGGVLPEAIHRALGDGS